MTAGMALRQEFKVYGLQQVTTAKLHDISEYRFLEVYVSFYIICHMLDLGIRARACREHSSRLPLHSAHSADSCLPLHL